ncbi:hypothetical protein H310_15222, partial [Aphanomyces invadans]
KTSRFKTTQADLAAIRTDIAVDFHKAFAGFNPAAVMNVDETGMSYGMPP